MRLGVAPRARPPSLQAQEVADRGHPGLAVGQDLAGPGQEGLARAGQHHLVAGPVEEGSAQLVFQGGHRAADRGLGHVQAGRGAGEPALLGHADHVAKLVQLHGNRLRLS